MSNHYHLLLRTPLANLSVAMRHLNGIYTQKFNILHKRDGSLFRGRYKAILIHLEDYFLKVSRYIHLNPVSANLCDHPANFTWSSYSFFIDEKSTPVWLNTKFTFGLLQDFSNESIKYSEFVLEGIDIEISEFYSKSILASILGNQEFISHHLKMLSNEQRINYATDINRLDKKILIERIFEAIANHIKIDICTLKNEKNKIINNYRSIAIFLACELGGTTHKEISMFLKNISQLTISNKIFRFKTRLKQDNTLQSLISNLWNSIMLMGGT